MTVTVGIDELAGNKSADKITPSISAACSRGVTFHPYKRSPLAPASFLDPARPIEGVRSPSGDGCLNEIKPDGYRLSDMAYLARLGDPSPLKWSALKYVFWHQGGPNAEEPG
jgi:hypothetical protein